MPARVSTWSVANILKLPSSKGLQPGYYPIYAPLDVYNHGRRTCQEPLCSEGRADCKGLEPQTQQRHITGNEFDFLTLNEFYFGSLALVVRMRVPGPHKQQDWSWRPDLARFRWRHLHITQTFWWTFCDAVEWSHQLKAARHLRHGPPCSVFRYWSPSWSSQEVSLQK